MSSVGQTVDGRIDAVAAAVSLTSEFVEETQRDAAQLAELSGQLETLTSVFRTAPA